MNVSHKLEPNLGVSVSTDYDFPGMGLVDEIDLISPPSDPLVFPVPTFSTCCRRNILAKDHRTGEKHLIKALMKKQPAGSFPCVETAYFLKNVLTKSEDGREKTWSAAVLRSVKDDRPMSRSGREWPFGIQWESTGDIVAVRVSSWKKLSAHNKQDLIQEVSALQYIGYSNSNVQGCLQLLKDDHRIYTVMPFNPADGLSLSGLIETAADKATFAKNKDGIIQPDEDRARTLFRQLCSGLLHLQQKGLYHGNICLQSLLLVEDETLVISDLGRSVRVPFTDPFNAGHVTDASESECRRLIRNVPNRGGAKYQAPEVGSGAFDAFSSDVWSAGVVLFHLLTGISLFRRAKTSDTVFKFVSKGNLRVLIESWGIALSEEACDLLQNMFWRNPRDRINLNEIMEHPWFTGETTPLQSKKRATSGACALPPPYFGHNMELLKQEIKAQSRDGRRGLAPRMRLSLRHELLQRTNPNSKQVSFGTAETVVYAPRDSAMTPFRGRGVLRTQSAPPVLRPQQSNERRIVHQEPLGSETVAPRKPEGLSHRRAWRFRKLVKSAKKTLMKGNHREKTSGKVHGPVVVSARTA